MFAGEKINIKAKVNVGLESDQTITTFSQGKTTLYSKAQLGIRADGSLALKGAGGSFDGGGALKLKGGRIDLNGGGADDVAPVKVMTKYTMDDTKFNASTGWQVETNKLQSVVTRAPAHEPWPYHNKGVAASVTIGEGDNPPPAAVPVPQDFSITKN